MDVLKLIEAQIKDINKAESSSFLSLIFNHLYRAEIYYQKGEKDAHFCNDVVYRTNQAFEGALKEAYKVLGNKTDEEIIKKTPNDIEKYLKDNNIFKERVLRLFENYRQEWRNKSTHDYKLVLDGNEAFLALITVSSFVHMLLKQVQEKLAYNQEKMKVIDAGFKARISEILDNKDERLVKKLIKILIMFSSEVIGNDNFNKAELMGKLYAFLENVDATFKVRIEPSLLINNSISIKPDFIIEYEKDKVIIEVKVESEQHDYKIEVSQVIAYLQVAKMSEGILFLVNAKTNDAQMRSFQNTVIDDDKAYTVHIVS
jgi:hypothetical protein